MILFPFVSSVEWLSDMLMVGPVYIHLYRNDVPVDYDTIKADLAELDVPGYAPVLSVGWSTPIIVSRRAQTEATQITWTRGIGGTPRDVFGMYATRGLDGSLLWIERAPAPPIPMQTAGQQVIFIPRLSLRSEKRRLRTGL